MLHKRRYQETSLIVQLLTRGGGRVACVAKGALRKKSKLGGVLEPLCLLHLETRGKSSLSTLTSAEVSYRHPILTDERLYAVFYLNELIMKLTAVNDILPNLFECYGHSIENLASEKDIQPVLRYFEVNLLKVLGFGLNLISDCKSGEDIIAENQYTYDVERGAVRTNSEIDSIKGSTLLSLAGGRTYQEVEAVEAKRLMRRIIQHYLGDRKIESRELFRSRSRKVKV